jgi:hypothetical protein
VTPTGHRRRHAPAPRAPHARADRHPGHPRLEGDAAGQLKARLTQVGDLGEAATTLATASDVRGVCDAVERWLQQLLHPPRVW